MLDSARFVPENYQKSGKIATGNSRQIFYSSKSTLFVHFAYLDTFHPRGEGKEYNASSAKFP